MCGIVGAVAERNITNVLLEGLKRLEYRGYDSAGLALVDQQALLYDKQVGKVANLEKEVHERQLKGALGIAHTRWATHGKPSVINAHPHLSDNAIAVVHNGIIENHEELKKELVAAGYQFVSETDTEVIVHLIHQHIEAGNDLLAAVKGTLSKLNGAFALGVVSANQPDQLITARLGSPLVIGLGIGENFIASDQLALRQVTDRFIFLEEGDVAQITKSNIAVWDSNDQAVEREIVTVTEADDKGEKGHYRHFMLKEIYEQPDVIRQTLQDRVSETGVLEAALGVKAQELLPAIKAVQIVACGTSYHAGLVARYWLESLAGIPCQVDIASEFRYRDVVVQADTLFVTISQSGETADTLAALRKAKELGYLASLAICNVPVSSLVRESDLSLMTRAGAEIGVASTKAFTTQLTALLFFTITLAKQQGLAAEQEKALVKSLLKLADTCKQVLTLDAEIKVMAEEFADKHHALFLGRGIHSPIAMEGALKLKEISYIHAEAYAAGELKHGPLALVDDDMPVIAVAPNDDLLEKLKSNLQEVQARGGQLFVFADKDAGFQNEPGIRVINLPHTSDALSPIVYTLPLQLLSYYVAILKGTDVDQPRNLAKSVTVE